MPEYFPPPPDYDYVTTLMMYEVALLYCSPHYVVLLEEFSCSFMVGL